MLRFLCCDGSEIYVAINHIVSIENVRGGGRDKSVLTLTGGRSLTVVGTASELSNNVNKNM